MCASVYVKTLSLWRPAAGYRSFAGCFCFLFHSGETQSLFSQRQNLLKSFLRDFFCFCVAMPSNLLLFVVVLILKTSNIQTHTGEFIHTKTGELCECCKEKQICGFKLWTKQFYVNHWEVHQKHTRVGVQPAKSGWVVHPIEFDRSWSFVGTARSTQQGERGKTAGTHCSTLTLQLLWKETKWQTQ